MEAETIHQRLRRVRTSVALTQRKFSERISVSFNYLAEMELGKKTINERIIRLVCSEFGIDEHWLRTGEGVMHGDEVSARVANMISLFKSLTPLFQGCALKQLNELAELAGVLKREQVN